MLSTIKEIMQKKTKYTRLVNKYHDLAAIGVAFLSGHRKPGQARNGRPRQQIPHSSQMIENVRSVGGQRGKHNSRMKGIRTVKRRRKALS